MVYILGGYKIIMHMPLNLIMEKLKGKIVYVHASIFRNIILKIHIKHI